MKNKILRYHNSIDIISLYVFMYCLFGLILLAITDFVNNDFIRSLIILAVPYFILSKKLVVKLNLSLHEILNLKK